MNVEQTFQKVSVKVPTLNSFFFFVLEFYGPSTYFSFFPRAQSVNLMVLDTELVVHDHLA